MSRFVQQIAAGGLSLRRARLETLQINLGRVCNQACRHCHVEAAPWRTETMTRAVAEKIGAWILRHRPPVVDLTGGAPELCPEFKYFVTLARSLGLQVIDRNNLTIIEEPGWDWLPGFLAENEVEIIASLPCYLEVNVNQQRGGGVFARSIRALRKLNAAGYGAVLPLHLVYNPLGAKLPPPQAELEKDYRETLHREYGIRFTHLLTITNQPVGRFAKDLEEQGCLGSYFDLLEASFNPATVPGLMCRTTLSVGYGGEIYDCDFNQMLGLAHRAGRPLFLWEVTPDALADTPILTGDHCLACTAGCGSSCTGAIAA